MRVCKTNSRSVLFLSLERLAILSRARRALQPDSRGRLSTGRAHILAARHQCSKFRSLHKARRTSNSHCNKRSMLPPPRCRNRWSGAGDSVLRLAKGIPMKRTKPRLTLQQERAAQKLTDVTMRFLAQLPPEEQDARIQTFAQAARGLSRPSASSAPRAKRRARTRTAPILRRSRGASQRTL